VELLKKKYSDDNEKLKDKIDDLRNKEVKVLLFDKYLRETNNEKQGVKSITNFFMKI
jgi:lipoate synthase